MNKLILKNYPDKFCTYGYMTLCEKCREHAPRHVDVNHEIKDYLPADHCEICGRYGKVMINRKLNKFLARPPIGLRRFKGTISHPGFHTSLDKDIAASYALGYILGHELHETENGKNYVSDYPVVVGIDMFDLTQKTDYDAEEMVKVVLQIHLKEIKNEVINKNKNIEDAMYETAEYPATGKEIDYNDVHQIISSKIDFSNPIGNILSTMNEKEMIKHVKYYIKNNKITNKLLMHATNQFRYTEDVDEDRIRKIYYVTPIANKVFNYNSEDYDEKRINREWPGFDIIDIDNAFDFTPNYNKVYDSEEFEETERLEYHGTSYRVLRKALPRLFKHLPIPPKPPYCLGE